MQVPLPPSSPPCMWHRSSSSSSLFLGRANEHRQPTTGMEGGKKRKNDNASDRPEVRNVLYVERPADTFACPYIYCTTHYLRRKFTKKRAIGRRTPKQYFENLSKEVPILHTIYAFFPFPVVFPHNAVSSLFFSGSFCSPWAFLLLLLLLLLPGGKLSRDDGERKKKEEEEGERRTRIGWMHFHSTSRYRIFSPTSLLAIYVGN